MLKKVTPDQYPKIIETYNTRGKSATYDVLREVYGIANTAHFMRRLKDTPELGYNPETDKFDATIEYDENDIFMKLDDLCVKAPIMDTKKSVDDSRTDAMEKLIHSLISDRLLELSKYILLDTVSKKIMIDRTSMISDGYQIIIH